MMFGLSSEDGKEVMIYFNLVQISFTEISLVQFSLIYIGRGLGFFCYGLGVFQVFYRDRGFLGFVKGSY